MMKSVWPMCWHFETVLKYPAHIIENNLTMGCQGLEGMKETCCYTSMSWTLNSLTIGDGRHAKHCQNGRVVFYAPWEVFILYNATSPF